MHLHINQFMKTHRTLNFDGIYVNDSIHVSNAYFFSY